MAKPVDVLRDAVDRFLSGDPERIGPIIHDDFVLHLPGRSQLAGDHKGREGFFAWFGKIQELSSGTFQLRPHDFAGSDEHAVGIYDVSAERGGNRFEWQQVNVYHVRDDKIAEVFATPRDQYAYDEFWS